MTSYLLEVLAADRRRRLYEGAARARVGRAEPRLRTGRYGIRRATKTGMRRSVRAWYSAYGG